MNTYKKYAFTVQILSSVMIISTAIFTITPWFLPSIYQKFSNNGLTMSCSNFDVTTFTMTQKLLGFFVSSISTMLIIFGLLLIIQVMKCIQKNEYFSLHTISLLNRITSLNNPPGQRCITLTFGSTELFNIMIFCFIFLIMTIFQKGYEIKHEQELTI
jgi:hypothetical protein